MKRFPNDAVMGEVECAIEGGERVLLTVNSGSMRPFMQVGDVVELAEVSSSELRRGDVVLFRYNGAHILHRIRHIRGNRLIIRGDGNYRRTETATRADVAARVVAVIRNSKRTEAGGCRWRRQSAVSLVRKFVRNLKIGLILRLKK